MPQNPPENPNEHPPGLQLPDIQPHVKLSTERREYARSHSMRALFEQWFGENTQATNFLTNVSSWLQRRLGVQDLDIPDQEFFGMLEKQESQAAIQSGIIAHRGLGYQFGHPNTTEGMEHSIRSGEREIEFDVRFGPDGNLMLRHDPFDGTNPQEGGTSFNSALAMFQRHPETRLFVDVKGGRRTVEAIVKSMQDADRAMANVPNYRPLLSRSALITFNPDAVAAIRELAPNCPIIFNYFPTGGFGVLDSTFMPAYSRGTLRHGHVHDILSVVDRLTGNTNLAGSFRNTGLSTNEANPFSAPGSNPPEERMTAYSMLPPESLLTMIRESRGAVTVPWPMVRDWPQFFIRVRQSGVRLGVFGFEDPNRVGNTAEQTRAATNRHNAEVRRAIALGANMITTDHPNYFSTGPTATANRQAAPPNNGNLPRAA